jgi:hypothetical protein
MDIIEPKRLSSLGSFKIHIKESTPGFKEVVLDKQYGFTTIADLKREIWMYHRGSPEWSPNRLWIASKQENGLYKPLDMTWTDQTTLSEGITSPFDFDGAPDSRLVDSDGNRKTVYPLLTEGLLLESVFGDITKDVHILVCNLESVVKNLVENKKTLLESPGILEGYIKLYFPKIQTIKDVLEATDEAFKVSSDYIAQRNERLEEINSVLKDPKLKKTEPFRLRHLRRWKGIIPTYPDESKTLDILFYEFKVSESVPFLRYFPAKGRGEPLLKLATGMSGFPIISDKDMLMSFLDEEPNLDFGAVMIAKIPFSSLATEVRATRNVALTIYWLEDGSSSITLEAPRRDMPLEFGVLEEAQNLLKSALMSLGYKEPLNIKMEELSAAYRIEIDAEKMNQKELLRRVPFFSPFLEESSYQEKSNTKVLLKWKAVNNYEQEGAVFAYFTKRTLEEDADMTTDTAEQIQKYIRGAMDEFGRSETDAKRLWADWFRRRKEVVPTGADPTAAHNSGVDIEIDISHPIYFISFVGIDSETTFKRVVSIMTAFLYYNKKGKVDEVPLVPVAPVINAAPAKAKAAAEANPDMARWMDLLGDDEEEEETEDNQDNQDNKEQQQEAPKDAKSVTLQSLKEWYKKQLDLFDEKLFGYSATNPTVTVYSRTCQFSVSRQPNILVPEQLDALVKEYGDAVEWVFLPPPDNIILDVEKLGNKELIAEMVKRGFTDIVDNKGKPKKKKEELVEIFQKSLCEEPGLQGQFCRILRKKEDQTDEKPMWFVARAGSEKVNYYICTEYWCVKDAKPLIPSEFHATKTRHGAKKEAESCPFCGGKTVEDLDNPKRGETVIKRKGKPGKGEIHDIIGYLKNIHPNKFALPCCFTHVSLKQMKPPEDAEPIPKDKQKEGDENPNQIASEKKEDDGEFDALEDEELTKVLKTMRTAYILGYEKRQLVPGRIGLCPAALDEILGQTSAQSVFKSVGVAQHFKPTAKLFVRFGLGNKGASPGLSFLELIGFYLGNLQRAGKPPLKGAKLDIPAVYTPNAVIKQLLPQDAKGDDLKFLINFRRAFERANYGNLVHEFAGSSDKLTPGEFQQFVKEQGFDLTKNPSIRPHVVRFANAWHNFANYLRDESAPKNLKHFENLFACPNVIFPNGMIPIIFEGTLTDEGMTVKVKCPEYGVSEYSKTVKPPLAFIWHDTSSNVYEPIIYVEATTKKDKKEKQKFVVMTTIHESDPKYTEIDKSIQDSMSDFIKQFLSFETGCGRYENPPHPWMPDLKSTTVPRLSTLLKIKATPEATPEYILRDRSNRLVGVLYKTPQSEIPVYIPALEDGFLGLQLKTLYDTQSLPNPPLEVLLNLLTPGKSPLAKIAGLKPVEILIHEKEMRYCALRTQSNAIIPFSPLKVDYAETVKNPHPIFVELMKKGAGAKPIVMLPWNEDIRFLRSGYESSDVAMDVVPDAVVEEAYNYLRISLSEWLATKEGKHTHRQLRGLKQAQLPLYEKRRRGDILLEPLIHNWLDTSSHKEAIPTLSLLRRNCIVESKESCAKSPMCSLIGNECKIHTGTSEAIPDIKVYFTSRIVDEIMRYATKSAEILEHTVPKIRMPLGTVKSVDYVLTSKSKIQDIAEDLDLNYVPKDPFSAGLSYPEDVHDEIMGQPIRAEYIDIPVDWKKAGLSRIPANPTIDRLKVSITEWTGKDYKAIEKAIHKVRKDKGLKLDNPVNWSDSDWLCFSEAFDTDVIITRYSYETDTTKVNKWIQSKKSGNYCIVFYVEQPEILLTTKKPIILPTIFQKFFDTAAPMTWQTQV